MFRFVLMLLLTLTVKQSTAQDTNQCHSLYAVAPDENSILQVWRVDLESGEAEMLTTMPQDVFSYAFSADSLVFNSDNQLWIQNGEETPRPLTDLHPPEYSPISLAVPTISGTTIIYNDGDGVRRISTEGGESVLLLENVYHNEHNGPADVHVYLKPEFLADGDSVLISVGLWEYQMPALISASTGAYTEIDVKFFSHSMPALENHILIYDAWGRFRQGLYRATPENFHNPTRLLEDVTPLLDEPADRGRIFVAQEYAPDRFMLLIEWQKDDNSQFLGLVDYDLKSGDPELIFKIEKDSSGAIDSNTEIFSAFWWPESVLSPDGRYLVGNQNMQHDDHYELFSPLLFYDIEKREFSDRLKNLPTPAKGLQFACE